MKIALCLYGYFNNKGDSNAGMKGYNYIKDNILKYPNVDVFIHSWDLENEDKIRGLYNPKFAVFDKQADFEALAKKRGLSQSDIDKDFNRSETIFKDCTIQSSLSFYTSRGASIIFKYTHELEYDFEYDVVVTARFDLGHRSGLHRGYNVSLMNFMPEADMQYIYSSMWAQLNAGYADQWFYSNSKNMNILIMMQEHAMHDFKIGSEYHKALINGWPDSNANDEFSNEFFQPTKTTNLIKYPTWQIINNHLYHKWFFMRVGLYEKSKFV